MTTEWMRNTIKVHVKAAEASGNFAAALALLALLDAIDAESALDNKISIQ